MQSLVLKKFSKELKHAVYLLVVAFITGIFLQVAITYREFPLTAMTHGAFYSTLAFSLVLFAIIPFSIAYLSGFLLTLISYLLNAKKKYQPQFFAAWMMLLVFVYFSAIFAINQHNTLTNLVDICNRAKVTRGSSKTVGLSCPSKAILVYPKMRACMSANDSSKQQGRCLSEQLALLGPGTDSLILK